jgi:selenocysteine lyase/cysteine desulfurase
MEMSRSADTMVDTAELAARRRRYPVLEHTAYLNAGTFGPLSQATLDVMHEELQRAVSDGRSGAPFFLGTLELRDRVRAGLARFVGVDPSSVALTTSTTEGCSIVALGLGLSAGDEIVTTTDEHFGLLGALHATGARVVVAPPDPARILAAVTNRTRLIAVSQVLWTTGAVLPVNELRERSGVPVLVDGAQSVGAIAVDAGSFDFLTISGQKWMCGPDATGAVVIADPERLRIAVTSFLSQSSYEPDGSFVPHEGARRFERSWLPPASLRGLETALDERPPWAFERALAATARCRELLAPRVELVDGGESSLVAFRPPAGDAAALVERLHEADVRVREIPGRDLVRASVGWWTDEGDLRRLVDGVGA